MERTLDPEKEAYLRANIRLADSYRRMSEIYEEWAGKGFENTKLSGLELALKWEGLSLENRKRHADDPENIKVGENNIHRIRDKIKECKENNHGDNEFGNT